MENPANFDGQHFPSFFQNSSPGTSAKEASATEELYENSDGDATQTRSMVDAVGGERNDGKIKSVVGGITCCVPECFSNSLRDPQLSFYVIPNGKSKEKQVLRKRWLHMISRKNFDNPGQGHRVCSKHFVDGRKTYMNNIPTIVPKNKDRKEQRMRTTVKARSRLSNLQKATKLFGNMNLSTEQTSDHVHIDSDPACHGHSEDQSISSGPEPSNDIENELMKRVAELELKNKQLEEANKDLRQQTGSEGKPNNFSADGLRDNPKLFRFYTGLPDYETFEIILESFGPAVNNLIYVGSNTNASKIISADHIKRGPKRSLPAEQEFFLVLVRLRLGLLEEDIAYRAGISTTHFSRIWITWLDFLHSKFRSYPIWRSKSSVMKTMPNCFKETYPSTRVIIDCTELYIERPSSLRSQSATYSNYKHYNTAKGLLGISPAGAVSFVSELYTGRTSDKNATRNSQLYGLLEKGDSVMADRGFDIESDLPEGVGLNIPPFMRGKEHLSLGEEIETRQIASVRIHVERAISRINSVLSSVFPLTMASQLNEIWVICAYLTNFLPPLINENAADD